MILLDANYILRFLLEDIEEMFREAEKIIENNLCYIENEVLAEVVFVLQKVYKVPKKDIEINLKEFLNLENIVSFEKELLKNALQVYSERNLDFVDAILCVKSKEFEVKTFDKKLIKCIKSFK